MIRGLQAADKTDRTLGVDPSCAFDTANPDGEVTAGKANVSSFTTPAGANYIRFQTFASDASASSHDLDMFVYLGRVVPNDGAVTMSPTVIGVSTR